MSAHDSIAACARLITESRSIGVLTGAGISTNAGIPDFRGPRGLYVTKRYDPEKVFDIDHFYRDQKPFYEFARDFVGLETSIQPTPAHRFLAGLEKNGKSVGIVTQNIDALHQRAGSSQVYEMHGSFQNSYCLDCGERFSFDHLQKKIAAELVPHCPCGGVIKPDIVFFGEGVKYLTEAMDLAQKADLFFVIGTSCVVYPAAMIPSYAGGRIVIINKHPVALTAGDVALSVEEDADVFLTEVKKSLEEF